ncbi:MAG: methylisocitrate lyase [Thermodesulfobacteriota bacterium]|nr:MAG: methylisocitrate lyase [Thermodesulfobacteriota bacterium]
MIKMKDSPGKILKQLMKEGIVMMPGAFNGLLARLVEEAGFKAVYISGAGLANGVAAMPDIGLLTMTEVLVQAGFITRAVDIPCIVDGDTGFGEPLNVIRMVEGLENIGAAGVHIEDQEMPKKCGHLSGKRLVSSRAMMEKIIAAVKARQDSDFLVIARTDARETEGLEGAIKRANLYVEAGADTVFPEALESREEFIRFAKEVKVPLLANMTEFGKTPYITAKEFEEMGYSMIIFPLTMMRVMLKTLKGSLERLKAGGSQKELLDEMFTRKELYDLIGYKYYEDMDKKIRGKNND